MPEELHIRTTVSMIHPIRVGALGFAVGLLIVAPARPASKDEIQRAVVRGVSYLKSLQTTGGTWPTHRVGATALAGLTLLECDVPADDPALDKAARYVRQNSLEFGDIYTTYALSLAILFLERLGDPADEPLIQGLAARVLAGQNPSGGWGYHCPLLSDEDVARLTSLMKQRALLVARRDLPRAERGDRRPRPALPPEVQRLVTGIEQRGPQLGGGLDAVFPVGDNSNTQFAILALWAARRHGIPVAQALSRTTLRFRNSQNGDGGWGYRPEGSGLAAGFGFGGSTPSMTCAGLLGVALGHGLASEAVLRTDSPAKAAKANAGRVPLDPAKDPVVRKGFVALGVCMVRPMGQELQGLVPEGAIRNINSARDYYFLWSLERVAVAYGLTTIGRKDWYSWGASAIVAAQRPDGGWRGKHGDDADTCFALLFLRRANLVRDLSAYLKGKVQDPGQAMLKSGGASGGELAQTNPMLTAPPTQEKAAARKQALGKSKPESPAPAPLQAEPDAGTLSKELVGASGRRQEELIEKLEESKGLVYSEALAAAIPQLSGAVKNRARAALAQRLSRMTPATLRAKFLDDNAEIRRAAAHACTAKADKQFVPDLISLLSDPLPSVTRAAHAALKNLTGQNFSADAADKWKAWWKTPSEK